MIDVVVPCSCPGKPHEQDTVSMPGVADVRIGMAVTAAIKAAPASQPEMEGAISEVFLHVAPREWTFVDEAGEPLPLNLDNIDARLQWATGGMEVAERANELYGGMVEGGVFAPLVHRRSKASRSGQTGSSTSPTPSPGSVTDSSDKPSLRTVTGGRKSGAKAS